MGVVDGGVFLSQLEGRSSQFSPFSVFNYVQLLHFSAAKKGRSKRPRSYKNPKTAPELTIKQYVKRNEEAVEECDWVDAMKYDLKAENIQISPARHLIITVFEVNPLTCEELMSHTLFPHLWHNSFEFRQVLEPGSEGPRCYRIEQQDWAGNISPSSLTKCWNPIENHEEVFWGCSETSDPEPAEEDSSLDTAAPEIDEEPTSVSKETISSSTQSGCSHFASLFVIPILLYTRKSRDNTAHI